MCLGIQFPNLLCQNRSTISRLVNLFHDTERVQNTDRSGRHWKTSVKFYGTLDIPSIKYNTVFYYFRNFFDKYRMCQEWTAWQPCNKENSSLSVTFATSKYLFAGAQCSHVKKFIHTVGLPVERQPDRSRLDGYEITIYYSRS